MTTTNGVYTPSSTPRQHPRIKPEAASYADRNRGGLERWFDYSGNDEYESPRPAGRTVTAEGKRNAELNKGSMSEIMGGYADPPIQRTIHPRGVSGDAQEIAEQNKGAGMKNLIENYGNLGLSDRPHPKVHGELAEEFAERNHGTVDNLMNNYGTHTPDTPPPQKVSYGGEEVAEKYRGAGMGPVLRMEGERTPPHEPKQGPLHKTSQGPGWDENPPAVRMRPEAENFAEKNTEDTMGNLMRGEVDPPTVREPKLPKHLQVAETPRPQTSPLRTRPEAMHNFQKNQSSEMSAILHGQADSGTPVRKVNRMMQRSEDCLQTDFEKWREETAEKERQLAESRISEKEVLNNMTKLVFNQSHLQDLKSAIGEVIDVFTEILETPTKSYKDIKTRLEKIHTNRWNKIQQRYNLKSADQVDGLTDDSKDSNGVTCVVLKFISHMDKCTQSVVNKLEEKHRDITVMEGKVKQMEERLCQTEDMFLHQKSMYMETSTKNAGLIATKQHLEEVMKEKTKRIEELERTANVQCWEFEKNRLLKDTTEKIKLLEEELEQIKQGREMYKKRMNNMDTSYQKMKIKQQLLKERADKHSTSSRDEMDSEEQESTDKLSRANFLQDKEINYLERELYALQSSTVGMIGGMKIDITKLGPKLVNEKGQLDKEFEQLSARVRKIYSAVLDGDLKKAKDELPAHYRYLEDDNFKVKKMRRLSQPTVPSTRVLHTMLDEKKKPDTNIGVIEEVSNPIIINPTTKKLHPINPLKYFGHMSQQFIYDQYDKFTEYDKNGDGSLDLTEVVKVVQYLGFAFNAHQLQEAMEEVDKDHNHTLDFYEYLLIIDNIYRRNGKASLFREGLTEIKSKNPTISKSCVIQ